MAVTKLWSVTERLGQVIDYATNPKKTSANIKREFSPEQYQALADVIAYAKDEEKTEREFYVEGINCNVAIARDQFITVKEQYQKTDGIQAYAVPAFTHAHVGEPYGCAILLNLIEVIC